MSIAALSLHSIIKRFGSVSALDGASLSATRGTVHALLGENGAGKTTLMRIAYGLEWPDEGTIELAGKRVALRAPADAIAHGIGMVQQQFALVPPMSVAENIILGGRGRIDPHETLERVRSLANRMSLHLDPRARAGDLPVAAQQKLELLKIFSRNANTLILDEPTSVLAPAETQELMTLIRRFADDGGTVILVTHKLREALAVADDVTVLKRGRAVLSGPAGEMSEVTLARAMFPEGIAPEITTRTSEGTGAVIAELRDVTLQDRRAPSGTHARVRASLVVHEKEIVGVAGIEGSGHHELLLALAGRLTPASGDVHLPHDIAFIPEHRLRDALIPAFSVAENIALRDAARARGRLPLKDIARRARRLVDDNAIRAASVSQPVRALSGGNQQKLVLARELAGHPTLVVAVNPTQGLDLRAASAIRTRLRAVRDAGAGVVVYSSDLDELLSLADRIVVVFGGAVREVTRDVDAIGRAMLGAAT